MKTNRILHGPGFNTASKSWAGLLVSWLKCSWNGSASTNSHPHSLKPRHLVCPRGPDPTMDTCAKRQISLYLWSSYCTLSVWSSSFNQVISEWTTRLNEVLIYQQCWVEAPEGTQGLCCFWRPTKVFCMPVVFGYKMLKMMQSVLF